MRIASSWYAGVVSAALAYHLAGFSLLLVRLPRHGGWVRLAENLYTDSLQALAFLALGVVCRMLTITAYRSIDVPSRVVLGDMCVVLLAFAVVAAIAIPLDTSGAALFGILVSLAWGLPT